MKRLLFTLSLLLTITAIANAKGIKSVTLRNGDMEMTVIDYGARIQSLKFCGTDVVLGFDTLANYKTIKQNFGAVVGRYIGRILGGHLEIDGKEYKLQTGTNGDCSHGGTPSFSQRQWNIVKKDWKSITLRYISPDGETVFRAN